jgi:hypothetical protein
VKNISLQECPMAPPDTHILRTISARFVGTTFALALVFSAASEIRAQATREFVGRVEGHDFVVENSLGQPLPPGELSELLSSGNRLVVRSGQARILLDGGGEILICGAAQLDILKAQGAITIALDHGTVRVHVKKADPVSVFTPLVLATTVAIGGGERDVTVGLEQSGQMCIRAKSGAVRVGQQLSGENLLVPQFGGLTLSGAQVNAVSASAPGCTCEADAARLAPPRANVTQVPPTANNIPSEPAIQSIQGSQISSPVHPSQLSANIADPALYESALTVVMPPLVFNASSPDESSDPALETVALARSIRVRDDTIIRGTVEPKGNYANVPTPKKTSDSNSTDHPGVFSRISGFFRKLFGGS